MKWISVKDELPSTEKEVGYSEGVLIYSEKRGIEVANMWRYFKDIHWNTYSGKSFQGNEVKCVTHWMPLPDIP